MTTTTKTLIAEMRFLDFTTGYYACHGNVDVRRNVQYPHNHRALPNIFGIYGINVSAKVADAFLTKYPSGLLGDDSGKCGAVEAFIAANK